MNSIIIKKNREKLLHYFSNMTYHQVLEHFDTDIEHLANILTQRRKKAIIRSIFEGNQTTMYPDSICWHCKHVTNRYGECSWSADLKPRKDWTDDCLFLTNDTLRVKNCPGFEFGTDFALDRKIAEIILTDAFKDDNGFISSNYFRRLGKKTFMKWVNIYNECLCMANLPTISVRNSCSD